MAQFIIICQVIGQGAEAADSLQLFIGGGHDRSEREIDWLQALCLQDLAPEIRVDGEGLPAHRQVCRMRRLIKAVHQPDTAVVQRRNDLGQKSRGHADIGVTDHQHLVADQTVQLNERGNLCVRSELFGADDQVRVLARMAGH
jgi:hypothetical protein